MDSAHTARRKALDQEADEVTRLIGELQERAVSRDARDPIHKEIKRAWEKLGDVQRELMALDLEARAWARSAR